MDFQKELKNRLNKKAAKKGGKTGGKKGCRKMDKQSNTIDVNQLSAFMGVPREQVQRAPAQDQGRREYLDRLTQLRGSLEQLSGPMEPSPEESGGGWGRGILASILLLTAGGAAAWGLTRDSEDEEGTDLPGPPMPPAETGTGSPKYV